MGRCLEQFRWGKSGWEQRHAILCEMRERLILLKLVDYLLIMYKIWSLLLKVYNPGRKAKQTHE